MFKRVVTVRYIVNKSKILAALKAAKMSQLGLAQRLGITVYLLNDLIHQRGNRKSFSQEQVKKITSILRGKNEQA